MRARDVLIAVLVAAAWGFTFVVIKVGLRDFPPLLFSALRFAVAALPLLWLWRQGPPAPWRYVLGIGVALGVGMFSLLFIGIDVGLPAGLASLIAQTQAFFTALLAALLLGDRPTSRQLAGMAVAAAGIWVIAEDIAADLGGGGSLLGLVLVLGAALAWAVANILTKQAGAGNALKLVIWTSAVSVLPLLLLSWIFEGGGRMVSSVLHMSWLGAGAVLFQAAIATLAAFGAWSQLLARYPASLVAPFSLLVPVFGMSSTALLLGETVSAAKLAGAALVMVGLAVTVTRPVRIGRRP
ncbi:MAG: EamA family transporter [Rhodospirillaceae bacterium]